MTHGTVNTKDSLVRLSADPFHHFGLDLFQIPTHVIQSLQEQKVEHIQNILLLGFSFTSFFEDMVLILVLSSQG